MHLWLAALLLAQSPLTQLDQLFNEDDDAKIAATLRKIYTETGLPTTRQTSGATAYQFLFLACSAGDPALKQAVNKEAQTRARRHEIPADAALYCRAHLHQEQIKQNAERQPPTNPALRDRIEALYQQDQAARDKQTFSPEKMAATDRKLQPAIEQIFAQHGVPAYATIGPEAANHFVVLIQHQSPALRRAALPKLKANVKKGQADPAAYAMMLDRARTDAGKKQLYGENLICDAVNPQLHPGPIEDEKNVNHRRAAIGLMRLDLYTRFVISISPNVCAAPVTPR